MSDGITTHVLDTSQGRPASGVPVWLEIRSEDGGWKEIGRSATDGDGRAILLTSKSRVPGGLYRLSFDTGAYFRAANVESFYPEVRIVFEVREPSPRCHVPLLLAPYGYSTYRGS
jgi:5-hydroxyisourate hydrolase